MKVVILGAGVVGVTTAYMLAKKGCKVVLIDQNSVPGQGASYANGGQLSYRYRTPIANPSVLKKLPGILLGLDAAFKIYPSLHLDFYRWGLRFLWQCLPKNSNHSSNVMRSIGALAQKNMAEIIQQTGIQFDYREQAGKVYIYQNSDALRHSAAADQQSVAWSKADLRKKLPDLSPNPNIVGGVYDNAEGAADSYQFCQQLTRYLQAHHSVTFLHDHKVEAIQQKEGEESRSVSYVKTDKGNIHGDHYIVAMGAQSAALMKPLGIYLPIYPMKGYSVTVPATSSCPDISVTDIHSKTVYCRLGDRLRIAGIAEFSDGSAQVKPQSIEWILQNARRFLPKAGDYDTVLDSWCGLRPVTPDSIPIVSRCEVNNLFLNTGHGMLGWTHSAATADLISNIVLEQPQPLDINTFSLSRF